MRRGNVSSCLVRTHHPDTAFQARFSEEATGQLFGQASLPFRAHSVPAGKASSGRSGGPAARCRRTRRSRTPRGTYRGQRSERAGFYRALQPPSRCHRGWAGGNLIRTAPRKRCGRDPAEISARWRRRTDQALNRRRSVVAGLLCRRTARCRSCARWYRRDAFHLVAAGLRGGEGIPDSVESRPKVFATFRQRRWGRCTSGG